MKKNLTTSITESTLPPSILVRHLKQSKTLSSILDPTCHGSRLMAGAQLQAALESLQLLILQKVLLSAQSKEDRHKVYTELETWMGFTLMITSASTINNPEHVLKVTF